MGLENVFIAHLNLWYLGSQEIYRESINKVTQSTSYYWIDGQFSIGRARLRWQGEPGLRMEERVCCLSKIIILCWRASGRTAVHQASAAKGQEQHRLGSELRAYE